MALSQNRTVTKVMSGRTPHGCSFAMMAWLVVVLVIFGLVALWWLWRAESFSLRSPQTAAASGSWWGKIASLIPNRSNSGAMYTVQITNGDVTQILRHSQTPHLQNLNATVHPDAVVVDGMYDNIIHVPVTIKFKPVVKNDGTVAIEVMDVVAGGIRMTPIMTDQIRQEISQNIQSEVGNHIKGKIKQIKLEEGKMVVEVEPGNP